MIRIPLPQATMITIETAHVRSYNPGKETRLVIWSNSKVEGRIAKRDLDGYATIASELRMILGTPGHYLPEELRLARISFSLTSDHCAGHLSKCHDTLIRRSLCAYRDHDCADVYFSDDSLQKFTIHHTGSEQISIDEIARIILEIVHGIQHFVPFATITLEPQIISDPLPLPDRVDESELIGITPQWVIVPRFISDYLKSREESEDYAQQCLDSIQSKE